MTKKQQQMLYAVTHSNSESLYDVYKTFSHAKYLAFDNCIYEMRRKDGFNFSITSATCISFVVGFCITTKTSICVVVIIQVVILMTL